MHNRFCVDIGYKKRTVLISWIWIVVLRQINKDLVLTGPGKHKNYTMESLILAQDER